MLYTVKPILGHVPGRNTSQPLSIMCVAPGICEEPIMHETTRVPHASSCLRVVHTIQVASKRLGRAHTARDQHALNA